MTYEQAIDYIHGVEWRGSKPGLSRTIELLQKLGNPQDELKFVHVAGTNGKGSTCAMLEGILRENGYCVGLYTSPYVYRFNERMKVNNISIGDAELAELVKEIKPYAESMQDSPTEFEIITALTFLYFKKKNCDIVVLETGLGGELDSTNVIKTPVLTVITTIGYDHTEYLGGTLEKIAQAKAGILKKDCPLVFYGGSEKICEVVLNRAKELNVNVKIPEFSKIINYKSDIGGQQIGYLQYEKVNLHLVGKFQQKNATVAIECAEILREIGYNLDRKKISEALGKVSWQGRFEVLSQNPMIILDGAHNPEGVRSAVDSLKMLFPKRKIHFLIGVMADKDVSNMIEMTDEVADSYITVTPNNARSMNAEELASRIGRGARACESIQDGAKELIRRSKEGIGCVLGSLYMSADVRESIINILGEKDEIGY